MDADKRRRDVIFGTSSRERKSTVPTETDSGGEVMEKMKLASAIIS